MNELINEKNSLFDINIKQIKFKTKKLINLKNIKIPNSLKNYKNSKVLLQRLNPNYLKRYNKKIIGNTNSIFNNKLFNIGNIDISNNKLKNFPFQNTFFNQNQNQNNLRNKIISEHFLTSSKTNGIIKRNKSNFSENQKMNIINTEINKYLKKISPKNIKSNIKEELLSLEKKDINKCFTSSTSNIFNRNSTTYDNHSKNLQNNINNINYGYDCDNNKIINIDSNNLSINNNKQNKNITAIEFQLSQLLAKKMVKNNSFKKIKKDKNDNDFNIEQLYLNYTNEIDKSSRSESIAQNDYNSYIECKDNNIISNEDYKIKNNSNIITNSLINNNINDNTSKDMSSRQWLSNIYDKKSNNTKIFTNPILKNAFLEKIFMNKTRKVNCIYRNSKKKLELNIHKDSHDKYNPLLITSDSESELFPEKIKIENKNKNNKKHKIRRNCSSFFILEKKNSILYKDKYNSSNDIEESKNVNKEKNIKIRNKNEDNKIYNLINNNKRKISKNIKRKLNNSISKPLYTSPNFYFLDNLNNNYNTNYLNGKILKELVWVKNKNLLRNTSLGKNYINIAPPKINNKIIKKINLLNGISTISKISKEDKYNIQNIKNFNKK